VIYAWCVNEFGDFESREAADSDEACRRHARSLEEDHLEISQMIDTLQCFVGDAGANQYQDLQLFEVAQTSQRFSTDGHVASGDGRVANCQAAQLGNARHMLNP